MKTKFNDLLAKRLNQGAFPIASKILDLGIEAEIISKVCNDKIAEDGRHAQIHCSNIIKWMGEIANNAEAVLQLHLNRDSEKS